MAETVFSMISMKYVVNMLLTTGEHMFKIVKGEWAMKNVIVLAFGLLATSMAYANCNGEKLDATKMVECITIEGAGENYDQWKQEYAKIGSGQSREENHFIKVSAKQSSPKPQ